MNKRIQVGDTFFEIPSQPTALPTQVTASKAATPEMLDPVAFMSSEPDLIAQYMTSRPAEAELDQMAMWQAFAGNRSTLPQQWLAYSEGKQKQCGFNTWAMLFGPQWLLFHKMFGIALLMLAFEYFFVWFAFLLFLDLVQQSGSTTAELLLKLAFLVAVTFPRLVLGALANISLFRKAKREITKVRDFSIDNKRKLAMIASAGSGSILPVILLCIAIVAIKII